MPTASPAAPAAPAAPAERTRYVDHRGARIVLFDFAGLSIDEGLGVVDEATRFVARHTPDGTLLTCTDVSETTYDRRIVERFKEFTVHNRPYVKAAAVVSPSKFHRAAISMIALFSRRKIEVFDTRAAALDWLASQR